MNRRTKGILCIIASAFCFSLMNMFVRLAGDLPTPQKAFFRNAVALLFAIVILVKSGEGFTLEKGNFKYLFSALLCGYCPAASSAISMPWTIWPSRTRPC